METVKTIQLIKEAAKKLCGSKMTKLKNQSVLEQVMKSVGLKNIQQVVLFIPLFEYSCKCFGGASIEDIAEYLNCSLLDIVDYTPEFDMMEKDGFIHSQIGSKMYTIEQCYAVNQDVMSAIIEGRKVEPGQVNQNSRIDRYMFCKMINDWTNNNNMTMELMLESLSKAEAAYTHDSFIKDICSAIPDPEDRILFYYTCKDFIDAYKSDEPFSIMAITLYKIYKQTYQVVCCTKAILQHSHPLIKANLISINDTDSEAKTNTMRMMLTEKGKQLFLGEDISSFTKPYFNLDRYSFAQAMYDYMKSKDYNKWDCSFAAEYISKVEDANPQLGFIAPLKELISDEMERLTFYIICQNCIKGLKNDIVSTLQQIYTITEGNKIMKQFKDGTHPLLSARLVDLGKEKDFFGDTTYLECTRKGKELFFEEDAEFYQDEIDTKSLIKPTDIPEKHLFFGKELSQQLSMVKNSLQKDRYEQLQERLQEKALPKGIAVLMYGLPGTGKTESVMQIARATGRPIMRVDISATKSAWFGESEKIIKKVFTDYKCLCEKSPLTPVLLFNEADAIFSKRKEANSGNVAQTENAIQNIILEEMEKLEGILVATTNLADNLDTAFERRFLFKIRFDKPSVEAKQNIWMDKIPALLPDDAKELAGNYDFSGGEIDNITRKITMREVLTGEPATISAIHEYCNEERITKDHHTRIGF